MVARLPDQPPQNLDHSHASIPVFRNFLDRFQIISVLDSIFAYLFTLHIILCLFKIHALPWTLHWRYDWVVQQAY